MMLFAGKGWIVWIENLDRSIATVAIIKYTCHEIGCSWKRSIERTGVRLIWIYFQKPSWRQHVQLTPSVKSLLNIISDRYNYLRCLCLNQRQSRCEKRHWERGKTYVNPQPFPQQDGDTNKTIKNLQQRIIILVQSWYSKTSLYWHLSVMDSSLCPNPKETKIFSQHIKIHLCTKDLPLGVHIKEDHPLLVISNWLKFQNCPTTSNMYLTMASMNKKWLFSTPCMLTSCFFGNNCLGDIAS